MFSASYRQWADAQNAVSEFERVIFRDGHPLAAQELSHLQSLRHIAASQLRGLIVELDDELARLHPGAEVSTRPGELTD